MDPISAIVGALAAGSLAALKDGANDAIKRAYGALRDLIRGRSEHVDIDAIERGPASEARRAVLAEELQTAGLSEDQEVLEAAIELAAILRQHDTAAAAAVGVDLEGIKAGNIRISGVDSTGSGVRARRVEATGDLTIESVKAGPEKLPTCRWPATWPATRFRWWS